MLINVFFTNNIVERLNRTINSLYKNNYRNFLTFSFGIKIIIKIYENHKEYKEIKLFITRVLAWWCRNSKINELLYDSNMETIINEYKTKNKLNFDNSNSDLNDINYFKYFRRQY